MPMEILKDDVRQLLVDGAQIVDVRPYAEHVVPVIVYCHDYQ